jgi:hypothetical protein
MHAVLAPPVIGKSVAVHVQIITKQHRAVPETSPVLNDALDGCCSVGMTKRQSCKAIQLPRPPDCLGPF